jgi:hypothetical protein
MWRGVLIGKVNHYFQSEHQIISFFLQALSTMGPTDNITFKQGVNLENINELTRP